MTQEVIENLCEYARKCSSASRHIAQLLYSNYPVALKTTQYSG